MNRRPPPLRLFWLLFAALHLSVPGAAELADARLVAEGASDVTHVESEAYKCASRVHPEQCALCHFLQTPAEEAGDATPRALASPLLTDLLAPEPHHPAGATPEGTALPRAPPASPGRRA